MQPHLKLSKGDISRVVLTCGDPARAKQIADLCKGSRELAWNREYRTFKGEYKDTEITVTSHGVGSAGAAICFEELIKIGAEVIIRVGTCGSLTDSLGQGDLIIANAAVREDGASQLLVPVGFPAVVDSRIADSLEKAAIERKCRYHRGIILTSDCFYPGVLQGTLELYSKAGVCGVEMECATLFIIGLLRGVRTGSISAVDGNPLKWDDGDYDPHGKKVAEGKKNMLEIALDAASELAMNN